MKITQRILIIDDHHLIVRGIEETAKQLGIGAMGALNAKSALQILQQYSFDLIVLDIDLPDIDGKTLLQLIRMGNTVTPVLISSGSEDINMILWMINNGAQGYINKSQPPEATTEAITTLLNGNSYIPVDLRSAITISQHDKENLAQHVKITPKQKEILVLLEKGMSNRDISKELHIAETTVGTHMKKIFKTLGVNNRTQCVKIAQNLGVL